MVNIIITILLTLSLPVFLSPLVESFTSHRETLSGTYLASYLLALSQSLS